MGLRIYGNRPLKTVPGPSTRPTAARVREALFNIWQGRVEGARWLDLCAGNGVMGAEALCRGAAQVVGIEQAGAACRTIQANWAGVAQPHQQYQVWRGEVCRLLPRLQGQQFDLIYLDPPYHSGLYGPVLGAIATHDLLAAGGEVVAEHDDTWQAVEAIAGLKHQRDKRYGRTWLSFYGRSS